MKKYINSSKIKKKKEFILERIMNFIFFISPIYVNKKFHLFEILFSMLFDMD